ncbi:MAG TPA: DegT/DnrJ/EryC1/StrS aminotransferase family protein [Epsilonproteobacteria bacterium]|nr:DegT/DnrJ/EryC1/StrS aminotransferase family protein [Campylobacterota bacterium]
MSREIPFYIPPINEKELQYVEEVLSLEGESKVEALENQFRDYIGAKYALAVSSGTSALHLAMCALDLKRGDKVVCSVNSFPDLPEVVRHFDAEPIFVDCERESYNIDLKKLDQVLAKNKSKKLRAVIINHMAGQTTDLHRLYEIAKSHNVKVIEDASDAMGAHYQGAKVGNTGAAITTFSFAPHLNQSVVQGGMFVTNDEAFYKRAKLFRTHAISNEKGGSYDEVDYLYDVVDIGWKYDMSEINAAFCLAQFEKLDASLERRSVIAQRYMEQLQNLSHVTLPQNNGEHIFRHFIIEIDKNRDHFARELKKEGINIGLHYIPLHFMRYYKQKYSLKVFDFPTALGVYQQAMSLPIYSSLKDDEVDHICEAVKKVAQAHI